MYCKQCGAPISASDNFCQKCGTATAQPEAGPAPGAHNAAADPANNYAPPAAAISNPEARFQGSIYAGFWRRTAAFIIDIVICYLALLATALGAAAAGGKALSAVSVIVLLVGYLAIFLYFPLMESSRHEGTLGKLALGIKVTDVEGHRIGFWHSFGRNVARILSGLPLYAGYVAAGVSRRKQAFHDMIARTLVVKRVVPEWQVASETGVATSASGVLIAAVAAIGGIFLIGIMAAIAIPAYQDYTVRAQVYEGLVAADDYKAAIAGALATGTEPEAVASGAEPALQERSGKYFSSLMVRYGVVAIRYGGMANRLIAGHTLVLYPVKSSEGDISWVCGRHQPPPGTRAFIDNIERVQQLTDIPDKFLPAACRS